MTFRGFIGFRRTSDKTTEYKLYSYLVKSFLVYEERNRDPFYRFMFKRQVEWRKNSCHSENDIVFVELKLKVVEIVSTAIIS